MVLPCFRKECGEESKAGNDGFNDCFTDKFDSLLRLVLLYSIP